MPASSTASSDARPPVSLPAFLRSVMPALDRAFGLEADPDLPEELAALVARLQDEPDAVFAGWSEPEPLAA